MKLREGCRINFHQIINTLRLTYSRNDQLTQFDKEKE